MKSRESKLGISAITYCLYPVISSHGLPCSVRLFVKAKPDSSLNDELLSAFACIYKHVSDVNCFNSVGLWLQVR